MTSTAAELNILDGVTATDRTQLCRWSDIEHPDSIGCKGTGTVSSLSDLSVTATADELNYVDGVTSNIQTQLMLKAQEQ